MLIAIDAGNTRLKFGVRPSGDPIRGDWLQVGALETQDAEALARTFAALAANGISGSSGPTQAIVSNVAGETAAAGIAKALSVWSSMTVPSTQSISSSRVRWVRSPTHQLGVTNGYAEPARLGTDRWCALVAAWHRRRAATIVVNCGTATTVDYLDAQGRFVGGMIVPGYALMKRSLAGNTAALPLADGSFQTQPRNTIDAIETGCLDAQAGAIERFAARAGCDFAVVTGGAATVVGPRLALPHQQFDHLTLEGLALIATTPDPSEV